MRAIQNWFLRPTSADSKTLFEPESAWYKALLVFIFLVAAFIRLADTRSPGHLIDREYTSAIFARAFYFQNNPQVEDWRREIAVKARDQQPVLEPPLNDYLVSLVYRLAGREDLNLSRYLTNFFWLLGGVFLYRSARMLVGVDAAFFATAYYLLVPMGIIISRSFQPDALMMLLYLSSLYSILLYFENPSQKRLGLASLISGFTLIIRPLVVFGLILSFLALAIMRARSWKGLFDRSFWIYSAISLVGPVVYYGYGILIAGFMRWKVSTSFMPYLFTKVDFWQGWYELGASVFGYGIIIFAILGFFIIENRAAQSWIASLAVSYFIFGVIFTYHIHTHPYYHLVILPMIAVAAAPVMAHIALLLKRLPGKTWLIPASAALLIVCYFSYDRVTDSFQIRGYEPPAAAQEIGQLVNHSPRVVYVASYYGLPLGYFGEFAGAPWPVRIEDEFYRAPSERERTVEDRLKALGFIPEYFVITNFDLYHRKHQDLKAYLEQNWKLLKQSDDYLVFTAP